VARHKRPQNMRTGLREPRHVNVAGWRSSSPRGSNQCSTPRLDNLPYFRPACYARLVGRLLLLFLLVPIAELYLLIEIGQRIGTISTLALIFLTALLGSTLARRQGLGVLRRIQTEMAQGRLPASSMVDGVLILLAGAVLITPGILTDLVGFLILIPATRGLIKAYLWKRIERAVQRGSARVHVDFGESGHASGYWQDRGETPIRGEIIDVDSGADNADQPEPNRAN